MAEDKKPISENLYSISTNAKAREGRTITITVPKINPPKINIKNLLTRGQALFLLGALIIGLIGGFFGGLIETYGYGGKIFTSATSSQTKLVGGNDQLIIGIAKNLSPSVVSINTTSNAQSVPNFIAYLYLT